MLYNAEVLPSVAYGGDIWAVRCDNRLWAAGMRLLRVTGDALFSITAESNT
jgi:hypothetical protein